MSVGISTINEEQARRILALEEGHFADLKAKDIKPAKLTKTISAFANAEGGELFIGIREVEANGVKTRVWEGFADIEEANGHIQAFETLFPLGQDFVYGFLRSPTGPGLVLQVLVHKTRDIKKASDGVVYLRRGAQGLPVDTDEKLRRLELDKGIVSFESESVGVDPSFVANTETMINFMLQVVPTGEPEDWLRKQLLLTKDKPTVAAVLLFAEEPQAILPKRCGLKLYRYATRDAAGTRDALVGQPQTIEGCIYSQIKEAVHATVAMVQQLQVLDEQGQRKQVQYPGEALHEIITNALIHRDYSIADDVHVRVFENRIEVESPGRLPGHITAENILQERFARNGQIVRIINKFPDPPNKDVGEGLNTAFEAMRRLELREPTIEDKANSVLVTIRHQRVDPPEVVIMRYLESNDQITNREVRDLCHIGSENRVKRIFDKMMQKDLIERVPGLLSNKTAYRKKT